MKRWYRATYYFNYPLERVNYDFQADGINDAQKAAFSWGRRYGFAEHPSVVRTLPIDFGKLREGVREEPCEHCCDNCPRYPSSGILSRFFPVRFPLKSEMEADRKDKDCHFSSVNKGSCSFVDKPDALDTIKPAVRRNHVLALKRLDKLYLVLRLFGIKHRETLMEKPQLTLIWGYLGEEHPEFFRQLFHTSKYNTALIEGEQ